MTEHILEDAINMAKEAKDQISTHEKICAIRYNSINSKLEENINSIKKIEKIQWGAAIGMISLLTTILLKLTIFNN